MRIITTFSRSFLFAYVFISLQENANAKTNFVVKNSDRIIDTEQPAPFPTNIERLLNNIERYIVTSAEAMPEDKYYFTPESLHIPGSDFKGVRTFAGQIKHLATDNIEIWAPITGEHVREDITDVNGPASIKTKAEIIKYLKESFALGHKVIATLTEKTAIETVEFRGKQLSRLDLAFYALTHANEHYGQMAVYLRMCGIVPPPTMADR
jgi:uncharacterized damage-inducible protein DinB